MNWSSLPFYFVLGFVVVEGKKLFGSWRRDGLKREPNKVGFPAGFEVQRVGIAAATPISHLPASEIVYYFREHPETAKALIIESYDKCFTPSTFIAEEGNGLIRVGWFTRDANYECVREFSDLADAATDYLLFSLGKDRWSSKQ